MELKYTKPLIVASIISLALGAFLILSGLLEFTGVLTTNANTTITTVGVQLSYLVFISGILVFISGGLTLLHKKYMDFIDLQVFIGVVALAWPIFVSIALFFAELTICIRLLPTMLSSLFYMITILVVKIANEALRKSHKFNPSAQIASLGKRKQSVNVTKMLNNQSAKSHFNIRISDISELFQRLQPKRKAGGSVLTRLFYSGTRKRGGMKGGFLYAGSRRRGKFRLKK